MRAHPGDVRVVELASLRGAPSLAERLVDLAVEIGMMLVLHLPRLALLRGRFQVKSSQVSTLPKAKSKTRSKQNKDMHKCSSVYSERGVPLPVLTSGGE